eukprot:Nk52_evm2s169 gene=Nk52_evmTU2s169
MDRKTPVSDSSADSLYENPAASVYDQPVPFIRAAGSAREQQRENSEYDCAEKLESSRMEKSEGAFVLYRKRFLMLFVIVMLNISNAVMWISFSPVACKAATYFDVSQGTINWLSIVFMACYIPLGFVSSYVLDSKGLFKGVVLCGALLNFVGGWARYASSFASTDDKFGVIMVGQIIAACAQPFILNSPTKLAAMWFGDKERTTANMVGTVSNPIGLAVSMVISPIVVTSPDDVETLLLVHAILASVCGLLSLLLRDEPPTPPTSSAAELSYPFLKGLKECFSKPHYIILLFAFGMGLGYVNTMTTILGQIANPQGYSDSESGLMGALLLGGGVIGSAILSPVVDRTKKYKTVLKVCFAIGTAAGIWFACVMKPGNLIQLYISCLIIGVCAFIVLPVTLELGVESTYPVAEGTSAGFLWMSGQIFGIILIFTADALKGPYSNTSGECNENAGGDMTDSLWAMSGFFVAGCVIVMFFNSDYLRVQAENRNKLEIVVDSSGSDNNTNISSGNGDDVQECNSSVLFESSKKT